MQSSLLTREVAEVIELRASHVAAGLDLDLRHEGRLHGEHTFDANTARNLSNREGLADASALATDHDALEDLNALFVAFANAYVNRDGVTHLEGGEITSERLVFDEIQGTHRVSLSFCLSTAALLLGRSECLKSGRVRLRKRPSA